MDVEVEREDSQSVSRSRKARAVVTDKGWSAGMIKPDIAPLTTT